MLTDLIARWLDRLAGRTQPPLDARVVRGIPVLVHNTRPDIATEAVFARLDAVLALIEQYAPRALQQFREDVAQILVRRYPCRGAYFPQERTCLVELTFSVNPDFSDAEIAATIVHEGMHARLDRMGGEYTSATAAEHERLCRQAEIDFGRAVPGGEPVVARALAAMAGTDEEVAPMAGATVEDWAEAQRRMREIDRQATRAQE